MIKECSLAIVVVLAPCPVGSVGLFFFRVLFGLLAQLSRSFASVSENVLQSQASPR